MRVIAIIGPFRARSWWRRWWHIQCAKRLARQVWELGAVAYLPHTMSGYLDQVIPDAVILPGLRELCRRCDAGVLVHGWERSSGSLDEKAAMEQQGLPVFESLDALKLWLISQEEKETT